MINSINEEKQFQKANNLFEKMERTKTREGKATVVEYVKKSDNATFGIVREGSQYTIKVTDKKSSVLVAEDFNYVNGYEARKRFQKNTLQEAIKYLHLFLNEEKYVVDVPVVTQTAPPAEEMPSPDMDMPTDGGMDETPPMDGEMGGEIGDEGAEGAGSDDQKEIQKMTGKLAQELRQEIADGNGPFTVGMFKSLIAPAKDLPSELKAKVMDKAEEVLSGDDNTQDADNNDTENDEMEAMNETIMNLKSLLSEEKKEKVYTEEEVEKMILSLVGSINKLRKAYKSVIDDPEVQKLLENVYHKLFELKSIQKRKGELQGKEKRKAMKKESAVQSTISYIKKNREMAEEAKPVMTVRDYKMAGQNLKGEVRVVPDDTKFDGLKESKRITLKEFKDMMEEGYFYGNDDEWEKIQQRFNITTPFDFDELKEYGEVTLDAKSEYDGEPLYDKITISLKTVDNGRNLMLRVEFEPQGEFQGGKISLENKKTEEELDNMILDSIIECFRDQIKHLEQRGIF